MNKNLKNTLDYKIRFWCELLLTVFTAVIAIVFITQIADIYYSGTAEVIYSRAIVGTRLKKLIAPMVIWVVLVIGCFVLSVIFKLDKKPKGMDDALVIKKLKAKLPQSAPEGLEEQYATVMKLQKIKFISYAVACVFALGTAIWAIVYLAITANFTENINGSILNLVRYVFSFICAAMLLFVGVGIFEKVTQKKELSAIKQIVAKSRDLPKMQYPLLDKFKTIKAFATTHESKFVWAARIVVLVLAVVFIGLGIWNDGFKDILNKAINICTECIGLG